MAWFYIFCFEKIRLFNFIKLKILIDNQSNLADERPERPFDDDDEQIKITPQIVSRKSKKKNFNLNNFNIKKFSFRKILS